MTRFMLIIDNEEALASGEDPDLDETEYEVGELLRSGYYNVEKFEVLL